jgi:hypothetical protein
MRPLGNNTRRNETSGQRSLAGSVIDSYLNHHAPVLSCSDCLVQLLLQWSYAQINVASCSAAVAANAYGLCSLGVSDAQESNPTLQTAERFQAEKVMAGVLGCVVVSLAGSDGPSSPPTIVAVSHVKI